MKGKIRNLKAEEIECRIGQIYDEGVSLLLYKNARVDQAILDEVFGIYGWQRTHEMIGNELYCTVQVWDNEKECWVAKQDVGTESNAEKAKGAASDSFKRACFNIGIGRELYTASFLWVPNSKLQIKEINGKKVIKDRFSIKSIEISGDKVITALEIVNQRSEVVYTMRKAAGKSAEKTAEKTKDKSEDKSGALTAVQKRNLRKEMIRTGVAEQAILERYGLSSLNEMTAEIYERAIAGLNKSKSVA